MATDKEFAQLANRVYNRTRDNRTPVPTGWTEVKWLRDAAYSGFSAGVYKKGNEIVISYTGTNEGKAADFLLANIPIGRGATSAQVNEAMRIYYETKAANPGATISFTGHSLGGGLASMMAVFFDKEAVIFDAAPFELGARNLESLIKYRAWALLNGFSDAAFNSYATSIDLADFTARESNVRSIALENEILGVLRAVAPTIYGGIEQVVPIGQQTLLSGSVLSNTAARVELHSMTLLASMLTSESFAQAVKKNPESLSAFFDSTLYKKNPETSTTANFLDKLYIAQVSNPAIPLLDRFGSDLQRLGADGMVAQGGVLKALTIAAMEYYYFNDAASATQLFNNDNNGIHLNLSDLGIEKGKSKALPLLVKAMRPFLGGEDFSEGELYAQDAWHIQSGTSGMIWSGGSDIARDLAIGGAQTDVLDGGGGADLLIGGAGADFLTGGAGTDILVGGVDADVLKGGTGNDKLLGGTGADIYQFTSGDGKDTIADSDGLGSVVLNGNTLAIAQAFGERDKWKDANGVIYQFNRKESDTKGWLTIKAGDTGDEITINDFDLTKARADGYLGIKLKSDPKVAVVTDAGTNFWSDFNANLSSLEGQEANIAEGTGKTFTVYLNAAAGQGDTITLSMASLGDKFKAILGDTTVDADGAVITLAEGQTQVSFALVQEGEVTSDGSAGLSVSYQGEDSAAESNTFTLNLQDTGEIARTYNGDQRAKLIGTEIDLNITPDKPSFGTYKWSATSWANDGTLNGGIEEADFADVIYAGSGNDKINGKGGNDALSGGAGNDEIDGGEGNDMIAGGTGSDDIQGGAGNDYISTSSPLAAPQRLKPTDSWSPPAGEEVKVSSATWGVYIGEEAGGGKVTIWAGIGNTDTGSTEGDVVDGGAGKDDIIASWGDDRVQGGDGDDRIDGLAGDDVLEGGDGDDNISADGITKEGYLNSVAAVNHGADFVDGGEGKDNLNGGGKDDQLFGGAGDDFLVGDSAGKTDGEYYVELQYHGQDYLDGEDGDDYLEGGGKEDTLYGGAGADSLWGDTGADNIVNESDNALMWANDYLDGEDGDDQLVGGGKDDTLYGGSGDDKLFGDEQNIALKAEFQGQDYLDGEDGDDYLEGGGKADILFGGKGKDNLWGDASTDALAGADHGDDYLDGEEDDDSLVGNGGADTLYGGAGKDNLFGDDSGSNLAGEFHGADYLDGEGDDDYLEGGGGSDTLIGGAGADTLIGDMQGATLAAQYHGDDTLDGGEGDDTLLGGGGNDTLIGGIGADFLSGDDSLSSNEAGEYTGDDTIDGGEGNDTVLGGKGNDTITGGAGDDMLFGGEGDDTISGGDGNDILAGGKGVNTLDGGAGDDGYYFTRGDGFMTITDSGGQNTLWLKPGIGIDDIKFSLGSLKITNGTPGDEIHIEGFDPSDALGSSAVQRVVFEGTGRLYTMAELLQTIGFDLEGTPQADSMVGTSLNDRINALDDNDAITALAGNDVVNAGAGDDYVDAGDGADTVNAGEGIDMVLGGEGNDTLLGGAGNDVLHGEAGDDTLDGGADDDELQGGTGSDLMSGGDGVDLLDGGDGADVINAGNGADTALGGEGNDTLLGGAGNDVLYGEAGDDTLDGGANDDELQGGTGSDLMSGGDGVDLLDGGEGNDTLRGGLGDDFLEGQAGSDALFGEDGDDVLLGGAGNDELSGGESDDQLDGGDGADLLLGGEGNDALQGGLGADTLDGGEGTDLLQGGAGDDVYLLRSADQIVLELADEGVDLVQTENTATLTDHVENLLLTGDQAVNGTGNTLDNVLTGNSAGNSLAGGAGNDSLNGGGGDDFLDGGEDADVMVGGAGSDTYLVDSSDDQIIEAAPRRMLRVETPPGLQDLLQQGWVLESAPDLSGWTMHPSGGSWVAPDQPGYRLQAQEAVYTLGNPVTGEVSDLPLTLDPFFDGDFDQVISSFSYSLSAGLEGLILSGSADIDGSGNQSSNEIIGNSGNNVLKGTSLNGLVDVYAPSTGRILFYEGNRLFAPRNDLEESLIDRFYRAEFEQQLTLWQGGIIDGEGNAFTNVTPGEGDELYGEDGDDQLFGSLDNDFLDGGAGNDYMFGGGGSDAMYGGSGDDFYDLSNLGSFSILNLIGYDDTGTPMLQEYFDEGVDTVLSGKDFVLGDHFENLTLAEGAYFGTGNELDNVLTANNGGSTLHGLAGDDTLLGGHSGDYLDGGDGADLMVGGYGYDTYIVDNVDDTVVETEWSYEGGVDLVETSLTSYTLGANLENLTLAGSADADGFGNEFDNVITGNGYSNHLVGSAGNDTLYGGEGDDILDGGLGDDTYYVDSSSDVADESTGDGTDWVVSSADTFTLGDGLDNLRLDDGITGIGNALHNILLGDSNNNLLVGMAGNDVLEGGEGRDTLIGGEGDETYTVNVSKSRTWNGPGHLEDEVIEEAGEGLDTMVLRSVDQGWSGTWGALIDPGSAEIVVPDHVENLDGSALLAKLSITGNSENNRIVGGSGQDDIAGGAGDDVILGDVGIPGQTAFVGSEAASAMDDFLYGLVLTPLPGLVDWNALRSQFGILDALPADADPAEYVALQMVAQLPDGSTLQSTIFWPRDAWHADYGPWEGGEQGYSDPWSETGNTLLVDAQGLVTVEVAAGTYFSFSDSMANWSQRPSAIWESFRQQFGVQDVFSSEPASGYVRVQSTNFPGIRNWGEVIAKDWPVYTLPFTVRDLLASAIITVHSDTLHGDGGNDVMDGGRGSDTLYGGDGDDELRGGDDAFVTITSSVLQNGEGIYGTALSTYTAPDNNDFLDGGSGNDYIDGQAGNDEILGGDGDDDLYGGDDNSVQGGSGYGGGGPVGLLAQAQSQYAGYGGYGGAIRYYSNEDLILGGQGNDRIDGGSGNDELFGGSGNDEIRGGADGWIDTSNDDYLDGGEGLDTLIGESGNDTYIVDGTSVENPDGRQPTVNLCDEENRFGVDRAPVRTWTSDVVIENIDGGYDTVHTTASVVLDNVETVVLLESAEILDIDATTGAGSQELTGNSGDNRLDGGLDADYMSGGDGDDTYVVDNTDDEIFEEWDEGFDTVRTDVDSYALGENLEGLVLEGVAVAGYGNDADNMVIGNIADNHLEGGAGDDTLAGWRGNDELLGGAGADTYAFSRGDGVDTVVDTEGAGKLRFSGDIVFSDLVFSREGDDLVVDVMQNGEVTGDRVVLAGWAVAPERVNSLEFCGSDPVPLDESVLNRAPVALVDSNEVTEDGPITATGNVLDNDSDPNAGQTLTLSNPGTYEGSYGSLVLSSDGSYVYHLNSSLDEIQALAAGETLGEVFGYLVQDSFTNPLAAESTLNITIFGSNDGPVALVDTAVVQEDQTLLATGNVLINDRDVDTNDVLTVASVGVMAGAYGSLALSADGSYAYTLNNTDPSVQSLRGDEQVTENFAYALTDGLDSAASALTVTVSGANDAPVAFADSGAVQEDQAPLVIGNVLSNDSDVDRATVLRVSSTGNFQGQWGVLTLNADGGYSYALNNSDPDVQALAEGQSVSDQFVYAVVDDDGNNPLTASSTLSIVITGSNDGPVALGDTASVQEDVSQNVAGNVLANDRDVDQGDMLSVVGAGVLAGNFGTLALEVDGNYVYSLNNADVAVQSLRGGQQATDSFGYGVTDTDASAVSSLTIAVVGTNDAPVAFADVAAVKEDAGIVAVGNVLSNDRDIDQATVLTVSTPGSYQGQWGVLTLNVDGSYSYALNNQAPEVQALAGGQSLRDEFVYSVVDDDALNPLNASSTLSITINGSNDAPLPQMDAAAVSEDGVVNVSGNVLTNDRDPDSGNLLVVTNPGSVVGTYGNLNLNSNGNYTFSLNNASQAVQSLAAGQTVTQLFTYSVQDNDIAPLNASSQLSITVTGVNDAPILVTAMADQGGREGQAFNFVVPLATFTDIDQGDVLSFSAQLINADGLAQTLPGWLSFNSATRAFSGTPDMSAGGSYSLRVTATDRSGATASDLFVLNVIDDCGCTDGTVINGRECRDDILNGTSCDDLIDGKSGNDKLYGNAGDDILDGGEGCDILDGGMGNDILVFGADSYWRGDNCTDAVTTNSGSPGVSGTGEQVSIEGHARSFDSFEGGAGIDTLRGSGEDDAILLEDGGNGPRIRNVEIIDGGWGNDVIDLSSVRYAYGDVKLIGGQGNDTLWSSAGNDILQGNDGSDTLDGGAGHDLLQGGTGDDFLDGRKGYGNDINQGQEGNDVITDGAGQNLLDGGSGTDTLTDGDAASFFFGGKNSDTIKTGKGADLIAFNRGDGSDTVFLGAESAVNDTLSLGKGIKYSNLKLKKSGNDLILDMGVVNSIADKMTFKNWYASSSNRTIGELQVVTVGGDYDAASSDKTRNKQVEVFDFTKLVQKFDAARAANSANANGWAVMNSMLDAHLQGSNTAALGGDLSFQYATTGSLVGIGLGAAQSSLGAGTDWQNLQARSQLEQGSVKLM